MDERPARAKGSWWVRRTRSFGDAGRGLWWVFVSQPNARIHAFATVCAIILGFWLKLAVLEWCAVLLAIGLVWMAEALNSALEALADCAAPEWHPLVGRAKDAAAGGVLAAAVVAMIVGVLVFGPKLLTSLA